MITLDFFKKWVLIFLPALFFSILFFMVGCNKPFFTDPTICYADLPTDTPEQTPEETEDTEETKATEEIDPSQLNCSLSTYLSATCDPKSSMLPLKKKSEAASSDPVRGCPVVSASSEDKKPEKTCCSEDDYCVDWCKHESYLNLSGESANSCLKMKKATVKRLAMLFSADVIGKSTASTLSKMTPSDIDLMCVAVKDLNPHLLENAIETFTAPRAKRLLHWFAETESAVSILENAEDNRGVEMLKKLLQTSSQKTGLQGVLEGLAEEVNISEHIKEQDHVMALSYKNFSNFIHKDIVELELCSSENHPVPFVRNPGRRVTNPAYSTTAGNLALSFSESACVLAVYCKIAPPLSKEGAKEGEHFRDITSEQLNISEVSEFISTPVSQGGLNTGPGTAKALIEDDADTWSDKACENLKYFWNNPPHLDFGL